MSTKDIKIENIPKKSAGSAVQRFGSYLSGMVMPNIGAFIAWGLITALFIPTGWFPNEQLASIVGPMLTYLLPLLIAYQGGKMVYGDRGAIIATIATMGVIVGSDVTMFIGAMAMGPFAAYLLKLFDKAFGQRIKTGFEMLYNNFSIGIIGFILAIIGFYVVGPFVSTLTGILGTGIDTVVNAGLLPLANVFIEPAKILFLNNAINHGVLSTLGIEQAAESGKSVLFLLESNPGPGLGVLLAFAFFGKGNAKSSAPGAIIIHFLGGIHEIYFPYVMMQPLLLISVIAGGVSGTFIFQLLGAGLSAAASPGSILAILAMTPKGSYIGVIAGVLVACAVSFVISMIILKATKGGDDDLEEKQAESSARKIAGKTGAAAIASMAGVKRIIFACDAGMGSSAMGASLLREKVKKSGLEIDVTNSSINNLPKEDGLLIITQEKLTQRAKEQIPNAVHISVENFLNSPKYDEIIEELK